MVHGLCFREDDKQTKPMQTINEIILRRVIQDAIRMHQFWVVQGRHDLARDAEAKRHQAERQLQEIEQRRLPNDG